MKTLNVGFLFVSCYATKCPRDAFCINDCICGNNVAAGTKNCKKDKDYCANPDGPVLNNYIASANILDHYIIANDDLHFCLSDTKEQILQCKEKDMCNKYGPKLCVPENERVKHGTFADKELTCVLQNNPAVQCGAKQYCHKFGKINNDACLTRATDGNDVMVTARVCTTITDQHIFTADLNTDNTNICEIGQHCKTGQCIDKCPSKSFCNKNKKCKCQNDESLIDCTATTEYCESATNDKGPIKGITKFLTHAQQGDGESYCVENETVSDIEYTMGKLCSLAEKCNSYANTADSLCVKSSNETTLNDGELAVGKKNQCFYLKGVRNCTIDSEVCIKTAMDTKTACVHTQQYAVIQHIIAFNKRRSGGGPPAPGVVALDTVKNELENIINGGEKEGNGTKDAEASDGVYGIAIGALIVGVINLFLIGSVLVLLLCFNNNKGNTGKKENA